MQQLTQPRGEDDMAQRLANLTLWQIICSVFAAGFGVQSKENKIRDFTQGKPLQFIIAGLLLTIAFLLALVLIVNMIV